VRQSHNGKRLPAKFANNLKINFNFMLDHSLNPLNQGISRNHKPRENFHAKATLSTTRETKPPRNQASERLELPYKGEVMNQIGENKQKQRNIECVIRISHDPLGNPFTYLKESITALDA
jgi:hypothetical protein